MKIIKYFFEFLLVIILLLLFKILNFKTASNLGGFIGKTFGPLFRSKKKYYRIYSKHTPMKKKKILN